MLKDLDTILEEIARGDDAPPETAPGELGALTGPDGSEAGEGEEDDEVTGYELDESDWEALVAIRDGQGANLDPETVAWLGTAGLVEGDPATLTPFAIEWMGRDD